MGQNTVLRQPHAIDVEHTAEIAASLLHREAVRISVILRATTRRLEQRQEALRVVARRPLALYMARAHGGDE